MKVPQNLSALRERYLRDPLSIRLGGIAANMARIASFSEHPAKPKANSSSSGPRRKLLFQFRPRW